MSLEKAMRLGMAVQERWLWLVWQAHRLQCL